MYGQTNIKINNKRTNRDVLRPWIPFYPSVVLKSRSLAAICFSRILISSVKRKFTCLPGEHICDLVSKQGSPVQKKEEKLEWYLKFHSLPRSKHTASRS